MNLPKRDGLHGRYYLIHKPETAPEVLAEADVCILDVLDGTARENRSGYPMVVLGSRLCSYVSGQVLYIDWGSAAEWELETVLSA